MARPKLNKIQLSNDEFKQLHKLIKSNDINQTQRTRCQIIVALDENHPPAATYDDCAAFLNVSRATISNAAKLYCSGGIDGVLTIKRNVNSDNAGRKVDGRTEAKIIQIACGPVPDGRSRWTIRLLEERMKIELEEPISREAIRRTLKKTGLDLTATTIGVSRV